MLIQPYPLNELHFAYCYRVYLRWRTHRARPIMQMACLDQTVLEGIASKYGVHVLECASSATDLLTLVSLKPEETISACTGKLKGQLSKWLREAQQLTQPTEQLSNGYFACTVGKSAREAVEQYLSLQSEHHGYSERALPPIFVEGYELSEDDETRVSAKHSAVVAQFHIVLATSRRRGIFGPQEGCAVAAEWRKLVMSLRAALLKVSFLPDHVHVALRTHPAVSPADLVVELMNTAQQVIFEKFAEAAIQARVERLWQPSAYIGSYGDLASPQISRYIQNWAGETDALATNVRLHETSSWHLEFSGASE
ncbi:MAG TPA: IS200/IS605 family transposase [Blastocatellia bacterium]|nr:IS200/IS605 family transposase [Blastocatellia bacterium]